MQKEEWEEVSEEGEGLSGGVIRPIRRVEETEEDRSDWKKEIEAKCGKSFTAQTEDLRALR